MSELSHDDLQRPAVADHVMHRHHKHVFVYRQLYKHRPDQSSARQIESSLRLRLQVREKPDFSLGLIHSAEIYILRLQITRLEDLLSRLSIHRWETCPQHFVARDDLIQSFAQGIRVEITSEPNSARYVVSRAPRLQLIDEPHPLLSKGKRDSVRSRRFHERRRYVFFSGSQGFLYSLSQPCYSQVFENAPYADADSEDFSHSRRYLCCQ